MAKKREDLFKKPGSKNWMFQASFPDVGQKQVSTGTDHKGNATTIRKRFIETAAESGFETAKKELQGENVPKGQERLSFEAFSPLYADEFAPIAKKGKPLGHRTVQSNLANLRRCMEAAGSNRVDRIPFDKVKAELLPKNPNKAQLNSFAGIVRSVKSIFRPDAIRFYATKGYKLADPFADQKYESATPEEYSPVDEGLRESIYTEVVAGNLQYVWGRNVRRKRKGSLVNVWREETVTLPPACQMIFFLALEAGMRRAEIEAARREWFSVQGDVCLVSIQNVEGQKNAMGKVVGEFQTKSRQKGIVPITRETWEMLLKLRGDDRPGYFVPRGSNLANEFTWILGWLRTKGIPDEKAIQRLRKEAGSLIARKGGIHKARKFLRHSSITVTDSYYVGTELDPVELKAKTLEEQVAAKYGIEPQKLKNWLEANKAAA